MDGKVSSFLLHSRSVFIVQLFRALSDLHKEPNNEPNNGALCREPTQKNPFARRNHEKESRLNVAVCANEHLCGIA